MIVFDYSTGLFTSAFPLSGGVLTGNISFNPSTLGIIGTATNDTAPVGTVGEPVRSVIASASAAANNTYQDTTTISLTAGDWDLSGVFQAFRNGATWTFWEYGISAGTAGNTFSDNVQADNRNDYTLTNAFDNISGCIASWRVSLVSTTTIRAKNYYLYSAGTPQSFCRISARRMR